MTELEVTAKVVKHVASLARIEIAEKDHTVFQRHMTEFLNHVRDLESVDTSGVEPFFSPAKENSSFYQQDNLRPDEVRPPLKVKELLQNAPKQTANQFRVDAVIEDA